MTNHSDSTRDPIINITGDRITLGPIMREHLHDFVRWINDFTALRTLGSALVGPTTVESEEEWYERTAKQSNAVLFMIREKATGIPIGNVGLNYIDRANRCAILGILIGEPSARGRGYGTEATQLMLDYSFTALGLHSVSLTCSEFNLAGQKAYVKAGFKECGRVRQNQWFGGRYWDTIYMDCLESEFSHSVLNHIFSPDQERS